jgi:6-pyruvoyltetrahydropterin/6-carboxytetrahydropterin synthase
VEVAVAKDTMDKTGLVLDFQYLKNKLKAVLEKLDHKYLNRIPYFKEFNPTSENIAKYIYDSLKRRVPCVSSVTVWESANSRATYEE